LEVIRADIGAEESPAEERPEVEVVGDGKGPRFPLLADIVPSFPSRVPRGEAKTPESLLALLGLDPGVAEAETVARPLALKALEGLGGWP